MDQNQKSSQRRPDFNHTYYRIEMKNKGDMQENSRIQTDKQKQKLKRC